ncbi:MAG: peptidoglycan-binding protein [bacterium]|nr:peptidoglycan-binding protein [bacterium]
MIQRLLVALLIFVSPIFVNAGEVRAIYFPVNGPNSFRDDFHEPRGVSGEREHLGVDIIAAKMTPVVSTVDGYVSYVVSPEASWGYSISVRDDAGYQYRYLHINNDTPGTDDGKGGEANAYVSGIKRGARVSAGQHIGWVGDSGNAEDTVSHLHFEIRGPNRTPINPYESLVAAAARSPISGSIKVGGGPVVVVDTKDGEQGVAAGAAYIFVTDLSEGMSGEAVRQLQFKLKAFGYFTSSVTGYFGPITRSGVIAYQLAQGINSTGTMNGETRALFNADISVIPGSNALPENLSEGSRKEAVRLLHTRLKNLGYYTGPISDYYNAVTREAVRKYQVANGLSPSGIVGQDTWEKLSQNIDQAVTVIGTNSAYVFIDNLSEGMRGEAVRQLQIKLKNLGYFMASVTDYFGPITRAAVVSFQMAKGIEPVGQVGPQTRAVLNGLSALGPLTPMPGILTGDMYDGMRSESVRLLQTMLKGLGHYKASITDYYDAATREAVRSFQNANGINPTGLVDLQTRDALNSVH